MTDLAVQDIDPQTLYEAPHNPRTIDLARFDQLKRSLVADPEMLRARPVIALPSGEVVAGNMRLRAVRELGWATVPTVYADLDDQRAREWMLRDNNEFGTWQDDSLSSLLAELQAGATDLSLLGFEDGELARLLGSVTEAPVASAQSEELELRYQIIVECHTEQRQAELLERFDSEGITCRALMS